MTVPLWKVAVLLVATWLIFAGPKGCELPEIVPSKPPLIVMLHEATWGTLSPEAIGAANELTAAGREVRMVDDDVTDGTGQTPDWLKPALDPGRAIMGGTDGKEKALVLLSGDRVLKSIKMPVTRPEIVEACK